MTRGVPPPEVFPTEEMVSCAGEALRRDPSVLLQYGSAQGYTPLREWLGQQNNVSPSQILMGNSSLELFAFLTQVVVKPGQRVFVESPSYDRSITLIRRAGGEVVGIPLEGDGVNLDALEAELKKGVPSLFYLISDFQNPMGVTTGAAKRERIVALARQYGFWVVEDAPYRSLRYRGQEAPTLLSMAPDRVLHMSSFSKVLSPGVRLGYLIGPAEMVAKLTAWAVDTYIGPVLPTQGMVYEYCRRGLLGTNIARLKEVYRPRLEATFAALERHLPGTTWSTPEGGFFVALHLPKGSDIETLMGRADEAGLKLSDGRGFFPNPEDGRRFLRIPFCSVKPDDMDVAMTRLAKIL
ncbi:MAG: PLP-dependent aminotransferase family protein [Chloroflexi bacterium]|nr:PLP-dependent aminotransferase family protein [Chloroflexota bacterium]